MVQQNRSLRDVALEREVRKILSRPGALTPSGVLDPRVVSIREARLIAEYRQKTEQTRRRGQVVSPLGALKNIARAFNRPLVPESAVRNIRGPLGPVARGLREVTSPTSLAIGAATAGAGPAISAGLRGATAVPGIVRTVGSNLVAPIARGPLPRRIAAEMGVQASGAIGSQAAGEATSNAPTPVRLAAPIVGGLAGGIGAIGGIRGAAALPRNRLQAGAAVGQVSHRLGLRVAGRPQVVGASIETPPPSVRSVEPPQPPPQEPVSQGLRFVADIRPLDDVIREVVTTDNPLLRASIGRGINPSIRKDLPIEKAVTAYGRQETAMREMVESAVEAALDVHAQKWTGRTGVAMPIDPDTGFVVGTSRPWQDVFSKPDSFNLERDTSDYVKDFLQVIDEAEQLRIAHGLAPRGTRTEDGWFYVPRQGLSKDGVEFGRPSSPHLQRIYDEALEGYNAGVRYDTNPRNTLSIHLRAAYREILERQLEEWLVKNTDSVVPRDLIPEPIRTRYIEAGDAHRKATREVARLRVPREVKGATGKAARDSLKAKRDAAKVNALRTRVEYEKARSAYKRSMESARKATTAPGRLFDREQSTISIGNYRNRFYPKEVTDTLERGIEHLGKRPLQAGAAETFTKLANTIRFLSSVGDFAMPLLQGQSMMFRNPVIWSRLTAAHFNAFLDPTVQARFVRDHMDTFQKMSQHGVPIGDVEFFAAARPGEGFSIPQALINMLPQGENARRVTREIGRQTIGRFQASYNMGLAVARALMWEALEHKFVGNEAELASLIRNMTGGMDSKALGVGPGQRAFEALFVSFSPRYLRSTLGLVGDALQPGKQSGRESLRILTSWAMGMLMVFYLAGIGLGKTQEEFREALNPLGGRKFLSYQINGDYVGVGGQFRALSSFIARMISTIGPGGQPAGDLLKGGIFQNPLIQAWYYRGAPGVGLLSPSIEFATGKDVDPFAEINSLPDLGLHFGTSMLPFALQGYLEGEQLRTAFMGFFGARTSPEFFQRKSSRGVGQDERGGKINRDVLPPVFRKSSRGVGQAERRGNINREVLPPLFR